MAPTLRQTDADGQTGHQPEGQLSRPCMGPPRITENRDTGWGCWSWGSVVLRLTHSPGRGGVGGVVSAQPQGLFCAVAPK